MQGNEKLDAFIKEVVADSASPWSQEFVASSIVKINKAYFEPTSAEAAGKAA